MYCHTALHALSEMDHMAPPGGHYSHAVVAQGMVYLSGQLPITADGEKLTHAPFEEQARQTLANISAILDACNAGVAQLVHVRIYIDDIANWGRFDAIYRTWVGEWKPARAVVPVPALHYGFKLEVEAVASLPQPADFA